MGTNYYFLTKDKKLARTYFAESSKYGNDIISSEYEIVDEPMLGYKIHLNKCSCGWKPLFQKHKCFETFTDLKKFYKDHYDILWVYDEYDRLYSWNEYEELVIDHANIKPRPVKWIYDYDELFLRNGRYLHTVNCKPEEADIFTPFNHAEYSRTEQEAAQKFGCDIYLSNLDYTPDPDYPFDWVSGQFS